MRAQFLYFPFDAAGLARIDPASPIEVTPGPADHPDWMRVRFKVTDATTPLPLRPMFSGQMFFLPDAPTATKTLPEIDFAFQWTAAEYDGWQTTGRVGVTLDARMLKELRKLPGLPDLFANRIWFWPVRIPQGLLYGPVRDPAAANPMFKHAEIRPVLGAKITKAAGAWPGAATASFLGGDYSPVIPWHDTDLTKDGLAQPTLPVLDPLADGTVEFWIATALATEDASIADGAYGTAALLGAYAGPVPTLAPDNELNASINAREFLTSLRSQMIGAAAPNALADAMFPAPAAATANVQISLLGTQDSVQTDSGIYLYGTLSEAHVRIRGATGTVLQDRGVPLHGRLTVTLPAAAAELPLALEITSPLLEVTRSPNGTLAGPWSIAAAAAGTTLRFTLAPTAPSETLLTRLTLDLSQSTVTREITRKRLEACDARLRPAVWPAAGIPVTDGAGNAIPANFVFVGTRQPWNNLNEWELRQIIRAVRGITGVPAGITVSTAHALLLWALEGKIAGTTTTFLPTIPISQARNKLKLRSLSPFGVKPAVDYDGVAPGNIRSLVRMWALFNLFGLDDFNHHAGVNDNLPTFDAATPIGTLAANHDAAFNTARARIVAAGLNPPDLATVNGAFSVTQVGAGAATDWEFRCAPDCVERIIGLQYCEFLRRVMELPANVTGTVADADGNPFDVRRFPAFHYMAFNGGISVSRTDPTIDPNKRVFIQWSTTNVEVNTPACPASDPQEAILCTKVTAQEIGFMVAGNTRRGSSRLNGAQFGALVDSYGRVFPLRL